MAKMPEHLSNLLKAESEAVRKQTLDALRLHDENLKQLSIGAQNIFKTASESAVLALEKSHDDLLTKVKDRGQDLVQALEAQGQQAARKIRWLMLWPVIGVTCMLIVVMSTGAIWSWWKVKQADIEVQQKQIEVLQLQAQIKSLTAAFCATPAGKLNCH